VSRGGEVENRKKRALEFRGFGGETNEGNAFDRTYKERGDSERRGESGRLGYRGGSIRECKLVIGAGSNATLAAVDGHLGLTPFTHRRIIPQKRRRRREN